MNENEWLTSEDPAAMLRHFDADAPPRRPWRKPPSERKLRLFACAAVRAIWSPMGRACARAVQLAEKYADGAELSGGADVLDWHVLRPDAAEGVARVLGDEQARTHLPACAALLREVVGSPFRPWCVAERRYAATLPDYQVLDLDALTPAVLSLAQAAYDDRLPDGTLDPLTLAATADALEEAGCDAVALLRHLRGWSACPCLYGYGPPPGKPQCDDGWSRSPGPHVRGCWALDLILGRS